MTSPIFMLTETLGPILEEIRDLNTLHECMLVNRTWCRAAAPILWRAPFKNRWLANRIMITTFIKCLDDASKEKLKLFRNFPSEALKTPTFDYTSFLCELQYTVLYDTVKSWCKEQDLDVYSNEEEDFFLVPITTILEMLVEKFMEKSRNLSKLSIPVVTHRNGEYVCLLKHNVAAQKCLPKIRYFDCDDCIPKNLLFASEFCINLNRLDIDCSWGNDEEVSTFIEAQNHLQHLTVTKRWPDLSDMDDENLRRSLKCVVLKDNKNCMDNGGPLSVLASCERLEILRFDKWLSLPEKDMNELASNSFPRLRKLSFTRCKPTAEIVRTMILMSGFNLEELTLSWKNQCDNEPSIIMVISENCPKLKYLDVPIERKDLSSGFYNLLRSCKRLQSLTINVHAGKDESYYTPYEVDHFLPLVGTIMPKSLYQLNIFAPWKFTTEALREFLMNSKNHFRCLGFFKSVTDDHLKVIVKYACERKTLSYLELRWCNTSQEERKWAKKSINVIAVYDDVGRRIE